jgi:hypothetical protein
LVLGIADVTAIAGSTTDGFYVTLTNTGSSPVDDIAIAGFNFGVTTTDSNLTFTDVNTGPVTASYIFGSNGLFGFDITTVASGTSVTAGDVYATPNAGVTVAGGTTTELGYVVFTLDPSTPAGPIVLTFSAFPTTSLSDPNGGDIGFTLPSSSDTTIQVTSGSVPEPAAVVLGLQAILLSGYVGRRRARMGAHALGQPARNNLPRMGLDNEAPFGKRGRTLQSVGDRLKVGFDDGYALFVDLVEAMHDRSDAAPRHRFGPGHGGFDRVQQRAIPMIFQNAPATLHRVVLAVIGRVVRQFHSQLMAVGELHQPFHELRA